LSEFVRMTTPRPRSANETEKPVKPPLPLPRRGRKHRAVPESPKASLLPRGVCVRRRFEQRTRRLGHRSPGEDWREAYTDGVGESQ
jgi:hypothetical protein